MDTVLFDLKWNVGDEFEIGLFSDLHIEPNGENAELKKALDYCLKRNIQIVVNGDVAGFVAPKDPRYDKKADKTRAAAVINEQIDQVVKFLVPYVEIISVISLGNHDDVPIKHYGVDPLAFVIERLNRLRQEKGLVDIFYGDYRGFITYRFKYAKGARTKNLVLYCHHGKGGSAPVTQGMIDLKRALAAADCDIVHMGHKHAWTQCAINQMGVNKNGNYVEKIRHGVMTPGFQNHEHHDGPGGDKTCSFEDRFYNSNPRGFAVLRVCPYMTNTDMELDYTITMRQ